MKGHPTKFIPGHQIRGARNPNWIGGKFLNSEGYVFVGTAGGGRQLEHVLVVERAMGKPLRATAPIHHVDGNKTHNAAPNLVACHDDAYHQLLHRRQRALASVGDPNAHRCQLCGTYDRQDDIKSFYASSGRFKAIHRSCRREYQRRQRQLRKSA